MSVQLHNSSITTDSSKPRENNRKDRMTRALANDSFPKKNNENPKNHSQTKQKKPDISSLFTKFTIGPFLNSKAKDNDIIHSQQQPSKNGFKFGYNDVYIVSLYIR